MKMRVFCQTDIGKKRTHNEDAVKVYENEYCKLLVVADGMGGHEAGEVASDIVLKKFDVCFNDQTRFETPESLRRWFKEHLILINEEILSYIETHRIIHGMGTTIALAVVTPTFIGIAHIGDSRAYLYKNHQLKQLTSDHTFVNRLIAEGKLTKRQAKKHPHRHVIVNALGVNQTLVFDFNLLEHYQFDSLLLCTDGLCSLVEDEEMIGILSSKQSTEDKVNTLIKIANDKGGYDNISIVLLECTEGSRTQ